MAWGTQNLLRDLSNVEEQKRGERLEGGVLIFGWGASRNGLILLCFASLLDSRGVSRTARNYDLRYAVLLILGFSIHTCAEDQWKGGGGWCGVLGLLAFSFSPSID